jgi:hypothetical protein
MSKVFIEDRRRYEAGTLQYSGAYTWHPDHLVLECECGRFLFYPSTRPVCQCGNDHDSVVQELADMRFEEELPPWYASRCWLHEG